MSVDHPSTVSGIVKRPFAEQSAFFRGKLGNLVPTARWDDLKGAQHDSAVMVAGAAKADLLQDLAVAIDRMVTEGRTLDSFRKDFQAIVAARGWTGWTGEGTAAGEAWRTRMICWGNCATSYSAGRLAQLREGGFPLWVYRHSERVETPRPEHLALDGVTLPPDHPFWTTHYTPGGWGCECYVVGARNPAAARRLGGDPDQPLPTGWDRINPATGTPPGVDRGWDYMPGDTVSDTVRQMAQKATQWEADLSRAYMESLPTAQRDALSRAYRALPSLANDVRLYAQRIIEDRTYLDIPPLQSLGTLPTSDTAAVRALVDIDVDGWDWAIDPAAVRSIGTVGGITPEHYRRLPALLNAGHLELGDAGRLRWSGTIDGEPIAAEFEVADRRLILRALHAGGA